MNATVFECLFKKVTRSSAVADRSCDASCLSVVSFSSTISGAPSFIIRLLWLQIYQCVGLQLGYGLFCSAYPSNAENNVEPCCHKEAPVVGVSAVIHLTLRSKLLTTLHQSSMPKPDVGRESRSLPILHAFDVPIRGVPVGILP